MSGVSKNSGNSQTNLGFYLLRGLTQIIQFEYTACYSNSDTQLRIGSVSTNFLDSPATTSATTYKVQFNSQNNVSNVLINNAGYGAVTSYITLMEIAA